MKKGFTIIELVVIVAIISITAIILIPQIAGNINSTHEVVCAANRTEIEKQLNYSLVNGEISETVLASNDGKSVKNVTNLIGYDIDNACNKEGGYIMYYSNGVVNVEYAGYTLSSEEKSDLEFAENVNTGRAILTDSSGDFHQINPKYNFDSLKSEFVRGSLNLSPGDTISDGVYTYAILWDSHISEPEGNNYTIVDLYEENSYNMIEITSNTNILCRNDLEFRDSGTRWNTEVKAGTIAYYSTVYYISPSDLDAYTIPPKGWIVLNIK